LDLEEYGPEVRKVAPSAEYPAAAGAANAAAAASAIAAARNLLNSCGREGAARGGAAGWEGRERRAGG
jgi:hypothetical protein